MVWEFQIRINGSGETKHDRGRGSSGRRDGVDRVGWEAGMSRPVEKKFVCTVCGRAFTAEARIAKYCPECRRKVRLEQQRAATQARLKRNRRGKKKSTLNEIAAEAKSAHMSYGKYVAMMEAKKKGEEKNGLEKIHT